MPEMKSYKPGMFCWVDLATKDPAAAKKFYSEVFGWKTEDQPVPGGPPYTMAMLGSAPVAGMMELMAEQKNKKMPPHWNAFVAVTNVDEVTKKATSLGATVHAPPMDVMDVGRMAVLADPSGATFSLWQPKKHPGAGRVNEHGAISWLELSTREVDKCGSFYSRLFNWKPEIKDMGTMKYTLFNDGTEQRAGMAPLKPNTPASIPSAWTVYFGVNDCNASAKKATSLGAKTVVGPENIPGVGRFAILTDPQGASFGIFEGTRK
jgi:predicted enzyme related to lactoylglutathione lyase